MDKRKLIQIIDKELEELKLLSEEVAENENDTSLIIQLAISKSRLLCQEFELLRELSAKDIAIPADYSTEENQVDEDEDEVSDVSISDPELEIVNFEEPELDEAPEDEDEDEDLPSFEDETKEDDFQEEDEDEPEVDEDDLTDTDLTDEEDQDESDEEFIEGEMEEEELIEFDENNEIEEVEIENSIPKVEQTELKMEASSEFREITIDEMDDEDLEPAKIPSVSNVTERPVMREIPKPEELFQEKPVIEESLQKERSLNDTISETKPVETTINVGAISSLRAAIGLNDRFLFIREIFGNNTDKYNSIIDQLDKLENQQQAVELLKANITLQKNETSMKFVDLLKRRFSK
jgi:hypothetical protein